MMEEGFAISSGKTQTTACFNSSNSVKFHIFTAVQSQTFWNFDFIKRTRRKPIWRAGQTKRKLHDLLAPFLFPSSCTIIRLQRLFRLHTWFEPLDEPQSICMRYIAQHARLPSCNWFYVTRHHLWVCCKRHSINLDWNVLLSICGKRRVIYFIV